MSGILDFKSSFEIENVSKDAYNCKIAMREQGWPLIWKLAVDVSVALAAVVGTAFISEFLVRRREARKTWATKSSENRSVQR